MRLKIVMFLLMTAFCGIVNGQNKGFTVTGNIKGLKDGSTVWLVNLLKTTGNSHQYDSLSAVAKNGKFTIKGKLKVAEGTFSGLWFHDTVPVPLFLTSSKIHAEGDVSNPKAIRVTGTSANADIIRFKESIADLNARRDTLQKQSAAADPNSVVGKELAAARSKIKTAWLQFIRENPNSLYTPFLALGTERMEVSLKERQQMYSSLTDRVKDSYYGKELKQSLDRAVMRVNTDVGSVLPMDYADNTPDGKTLSLGDVAYPSKLTLIDFWASWCGPCREENPFVKKLYAEYKDKGFNIISISLDSQLEPWKQAIAKDELPWHHISDLGGWKSRATAVFDIKHVPQTFLIDNTGRIIAKPIGHEELRKEVEQVLGKQ